MGLGWPRGLHGRPISGSWEVSSLLPTRPCRMILSVLTGLLLGSDGYYVALAWTSSALMYFIVSRDPLPRGGAGGEPPPPGPASPSSFQVRSLRTAALGPDSMGGLGARQRLQLYLTLGAAAFQPLIIYWLTFHLVW